MKEEELIEICRGGEPEALARYPFWSSEVYGFGRLIRSYGFYPSRLPLNISTDHGPCQLDRPLKSLLENKAYAHFYHSPRLVERWREMSGRRCFVLPAPFVYYRRTRNVTRSPEAKGTLVFPTHSTHYISVEKEWRRYVESLQALPDKFHPLAACLYFLDVQKGLHRIFREYGIPVFSAGQWLDERFPERFYDIARNYRYATSSGPGSHLFYCVEMGIPFFLHGEKPVLHSRGGDNEETGTYRPFDERDQVRKIHRLFAERVDAVTPAQKDFVEYELGLKGGVSRRRMAVILYSAYAALQARRSAGGLKRLRAHAAAMIPAPLKKKLNALAGRK